MSNFSGKDFNHCPLWLRFEPLLSQGRSKTRGKGPSGRNGIGPLPFKRTIVCLKVDVPMVSIRGVVDCLLASVETMMNE